MSISGVASQTNCTCGTDLLRRQTCKADRRRCGGKVRRRRGGLTVTAGRERILDFTQPFYATGLGITVPAGGETSWLPLIRTMTSFGFAQAILALIGFALAAGFLVWFFERRHNEDFGGGVARGLSSGVWRSTVAMTQRSTGNFGPRTHLGRIVAIVWMVASIVIIAVFTGSITSVLTIKHLQGAVHGVSDLSVVRVWRIGRNLHRGHAFRYASYLRKFVTLQEGLQALRAHKLMHLYTTNRCWPGQ